MTPIQLVSRVWVGIRCITKSVDVVKSNSLLKLELLA
jgi:hypothetical protein